MADQGLSTNTLNECMTTAAVEPYLFRIRDLINYSAGIYHPDTKLYYVEDRATRRMRAIGVSTLREYYDVLTTRPERDVELRNLLNEITVGETAFFRNTPQIDGFRHTILPALIQAKSNFNFTRLRIWSAGCSTGEEAYTFAMILLDEMKAALRGWTVEIIATDLNDRSLAKAREGSYDEYALRTLPAYFRERYFQPRNGRLVVKEEVKALVTFDRLNLMDESRMVFMKAMDIILCCNVLIYFDSKMKLRTIQHFHNNLLPYGCLFLGHSESLFGVSDSFHLVPFPGGAAYRKASSKSRTAPGPFAGNI